MRSLSIDGMRSLFAQDTDDVFTFGVRISHPDWDDSIRAVNDTVDITHESELYIAYPFKTELPSQSDGMIPKASLIVDNIERTYIDKLRTIQSPPTVELFVFRRSVTTGDMVEIGPLKLKASLFTYNVTSLTITITSDTDYLNEQATKDRFLPSNSAGLF